MGKKLGPAQDKINRVNVKLIRSRFTNPQETIVKKKLEELTELTSTTKDPVSWWFVSEKEKTAPPWIGFANSHVKETVESPEAIAQSCLLFIEVKKRLFVITFGSSARSYLKPEAIERTFGYDVANRVLDPQSISHLESCILEANSMRSNRQVPLGATIDRFSLDALKDNVRKLSGRTKSDSLGKRLHGSDGLIANQTMSLRQIAKLCERWLEVYLSAQESDDLIWTNFANPLTDPYLINDLNTVLERKLRAGQTDNFVVGLPELYDPEQTEGFRFSGESDDQFDFELSFKRYLKNQIHPLGVTAEDLKKHKVQSRNTETGIVSNKWSVWECLEIEVTKDRETYLLHSGDWYLIPKSIVEKIDAEINKLPEADLNFPTTWSKEKEGELNLRIGKMNRMVLMDKKLARGPGFESGVELCDLLHLDKAMLIHVKRGTSSATLSHLFNQGVNSAKMLLVEEEFRVSVKAVLKSETDEFTSEKFMKRTDHTVVYAIATPKVGRWSEILPFFSKLSLYNALKEFRAMRLEVRILRIEVRDGAVVKTKLRRSNDVDAF